MVKAEVVFDGALIKIGDFVILTDSLLYVYKDMERVKSFWNVEQAIQYCLENSDSEVLK